MFVFWCCCFTTTMSVSVVRFFFNLFVYLKLFLCAEFTLSAKDSLFVVLLIFLFIKQFFYFLFFFGRAKPSSSSLHWRIDGRRITNKFFLWFVVVRLVVVVAATVMNILVMRGNRKGVLFRMWFYCLFDLS